MKEYSGFWLASFLSGMALNVDEELLSIFLCSGAATIFRMLYEKKYREQKIDLTRMALICIVSLALPYLINEIIVGNKAIEKARLLVLFATGAIAVDVVEIWVSLIPQKIREIINMIPELIRKRVGLEKKDDK